MRKKVIIAGILFLLTSGGLAFADDPVLLATMTVGMTHGSQEVFDTRWPVLTYTIDNNDFQYPLFEDKAISGPFPVVTDEIVTSSSDADFDGFVELITNGYDEEILVLQWGDAGLGAGGGGGFESSELDPLVPAFGPDLIGYNVDYIRQFLTVDIESPGSDPLGDGIWTDWSVTGYYEFYGTVVPEPCYVTGIFLAIVFMKNRKRL